MRNLKVKMTKINFKLKYHLKKMGWFGLFLSKPKHAIKTDWMNKEQKNTQKNKTQDLCTTNMNVYIRQGFVLFEV